MTELDENACIRLDGIFLHLMECESIIYNGKPGDKRVIARRREGVWSIEADGENVIEVSRFECDGKHLTLEVIKFDKPGKWRVLLERVE